MRVENKINQAGRMEVEPMAPEVSRGARRLAVYGAALIVLFSIPLYQLARLALEEDLYSHAPLMPVIAAYLVWLTRHRLPKTICPSRIGTICFAGLGAVFLAGWAFFAFRGVTLPLNDQLAWQMGALVSFIIAGVFHFLGAGIARVTAYPLGLLVFLIPFPTGVRHGLEVVLQHSSAEVAYWMIKIAQIPVLRDGVVFALPGIVIQVAEECSGIRSSFVLFITGLIGGFLFLENPKHRFWFTLLTIPLGILRNGFRVLTLALLCVHVDPKMIHSFIHHRGGPIFFALSLIPFFALLLYWRKKELREAQNRQATTGIVEKH
ncbi:MAG: exosortase [Verrucomicrobia bacterium]|nr:exosortase [Verrucomicrobiota bacterium]